MIHWLCRIHTIGLIPSFPRLLAVAAETQNSAAYHHEGRLRQREQYALFKFSLKGRGVFRNAQGEHRVAAGQGFLCFISDPSTAYYYPADGREPWNFVYITFGGGNSRELVRDLTDRYGPVFDLPRKAGPINRFVGFGAHAHGPMELTAAAGAELVMDLLCRLSASREQGRGPDPAEELVRRVKHLVATRPLDVQNVGDLARELDVSREHITRVFKSCTTFTPYLYIRRVRVQQACHLLKTTTLTTKEVAARLGFAQPAHFARTFKAIMQMTPSTFRRQGVMPILE